MTPQPTTAGRTEPRAYLDVHPWLTDIANTGEVRFVGTHRVALSYLRVATPAICFRDYRELHSLTPFIGKLQNFLKTEIKAFLMTVPNVPWISMGVDHTCPHLHGAPNLWAILHDTLALQGHYGPDAKRRYHQGAAHVKQFICVSHTSRERFELEYPLLLTNRRFHYLPNSHHFRERLWKKMPETERPRTRASISLHSVLPYKNLERTLEIADKLRLNHLHIGRGDLNSVLKSTGGMISWMGNSDDEAVRDMMQCSGTFICSSHDEGFSLPPMEAMIYGVPRIILSDIPVHKEIYGRYNVNFMSPRLGAAVFTDLSEVTDEERDDIYTRFHPDTHYKQLTAIL